MNREYQKWRSRSLNRDMELLVFGDRGTRILFFPTRKARFYDYENWGIIESVKHKIEAGEYQIICVDSIDSESFYNLNIPPKDRILRHLEYEKYILEEVLPFTEKKNRNSELVVAGCSLGAYHAVNLCLRHPHLMKKVVGLSGRYDLTQAMRSFKDLFQGYVDENVYLNTPNRFITHLDDPKYIESIKLLEIIIAVGKDDAFLQDNQFLSKILLSKDIKHNLYIWNGEAHNPVDWKRMAQLYF